MAKIFNRVEHRLSKYTVHYNISLCIYDLAVVLISEEDKVVIELTDKYFYYFNKKRLLQAYGLRIAYLVTAEQDWINHLAISKEESLQLLVKQFRLKV